MAWHVTDDVEQWLAAVGDLLLHEPGRNTIALTVAENVRHRPDGTRFAWWAQDGDVTGAALHAAGFPVLICTAPDAGVSALPDVWSFDRVAGTTALAVQTARLAARGGRVEVLAAERLFRLGELVVPVVPGTARLAEDSDQDLLVPWFEAFLEEAGILVRPDPVASVAERIARAGVVLWEDGEVRAMAGLQRPAFGGVRLGPVYTPPSLRGRGYGAAATAAAARRALDLGASEVVLYTDLTNPTSNALYPRLGFRPVEDRAVLQICH